MIRWIFVFLSNKTPSLTPSGGGGGDAHVATAPFWRTATSNLTAPFLQSYPLLRPYTIALFFPCCHSINLLSCITQFAYLPMRWLWVIYYNYSEMCQYLDLCTLLAYLKEHFENRHWQKSISKKSSFPAYITLFSWIIHERQLMCTKSFAYGEPSIARCQLSADTV